MDERILKWLFDIKIAIDEIDTYFLETPKDFKHYSSNIILKRAVERDLLKIEVEELINQAT